VRSGALAPLLVLALTSGCASVTPQKLDFSPLVAVELDLSRGLAAGFSDFEEHKAAEGKNGVVELWGKHTVQAREESSAWQVSITAIVMSSAETAERELADQCVIYNRKAGLFPGEIETAGQGDAQWCWSPVVRLRKDPEGGPLTSATFYSVAAFQRDRLVIEMTESHSDEPATVKNAIIRELAERLRKISAAGAAK
jgi:hypothetical protein